MGRKRKRREKRKKRRKPLLDVAPVLYQSYKATKRNALRSKHTHSDTLTAMHVVSEDVYQWQTQCLQTDSQLHRVTMYKHTGVHTHLTLRSSGYSQTAIHTLGPSFSPPQILLRSPQFLGILLQDPGGSCGGQLCSPSQTHCGSQRWPACSSGVCGSRSPRGN